MWTRFHTSRRSPTVVRRRSIIMTRVYCLLLFYKSPGMSCRRDPVEQLHENTAPVRTDFFSTVRARSASQVKPSGQVGESVSATISRITRQVSLIFRSHTVRAVVMVTTILVSSTLDHFGREVYIAAYAHNDSRVDESTNIYITVSRKRDIELIY